MSKFSVPSFEAAVAPVVAASKLSVAQLEKLASFQFALVQDYAELSLSRLKAATEISDLAGLKAYGEASVGVAKDVGAKVQADAKALVELLTGFGAEYKGLVRV